MMKQIMIPVAAFAVTVTGASAFNSEMLSKLDVDLTNGQITALETAHDMRAEGADRDEVKALLEDAGLDRSTMQEIREAAHAVRDAHREAVKTALEEDDYDAFLTAIADTPLAEAITSEADFETFKTAHELRQAGDHEGAAELMAELGIEKPAGHGGRSGVMGGHGERGDRDGYGGPRSIGTDV